MAQQCGILLDVNLFADITRILFAIRFVDNRAEIDVTDATGSFDKFHSVP